MLADRLEGLAGRAEEAYYALGQTLGYTAPDTVRIVHSADTLIRLASELRALAHEARS